MNRNLWINPAVGISGDMLLGALFDVGASEDFVRDALLSLKVDGWQMKVDKIVKQGLLSTRAEISCDDTAHHRSWSDIDSLIANSSLQIEVADGARKSFKLLAEVEAKRHGIDVEEVHFHEVGSIDAIIDIVGAWSALKSLQISKVISTNVGMGAGSVETAHGLLPNPAPATMDILKGCCVRGVDTEFETVTPTGAALLVTMTDAWGPIPEGRIIESGFGAGFYEPATHPNVLNIVITESDNSFRSESIVIETTVDDVTPEVLGHLIPNLINSGADDAWIIPVIMKKTRPGHELKVLCSENIREKIVQIIAKETGTLGMRIYPVSKEVLSRTEETVKVHDTEIRIKIGPYGVKPEHDDISLLAKISDLTLKEATKQVFLEWEKKIDKANRKDSK